MASSLGLTWFDCCCCSWCYCISLLPIFFSLSCLENYFARYISIFFCSRIIMNSILERSIALTPHNQCGTLLRRYIRSAISLNHTVFRFNICASRREEQVTTTMTAHICRNGDTFCMWHILSFLFKRKKSGQTNQ